MEIYNQKDFPENDNGLYGPQQPFLRDRLEIRERENELRRKSEMLEVSKKSKFSFEVPSWTFEGCFETKMVSKHFLELPAKMPTQFPCVK